MRLDTLTKLVTLILAIATPMVAIYQYQQNESQDRQNESQDRQNKKFRMEQTRIENDLKAEQQRLENDLKAEQQRLESKVVQSRFIDQLLTRIERYLDKLGTLEDEERSEAQRRTPPAPASGLDEKDKLRIMILLSNIAVESHLQRNEGGETEKQRALLEDIPLRFALLAEDDSMLVTMSKTEAEIGRWADFAEEAASSTIKKTAAKALSRIALTTDAAEQRKDILRRVHKLARDTSQLDKTKDNAATRALETIYAAFKDDSKDASEEAIRQIASEMTQAALFLEDAPSQSRVVEAPLQFAAPVSGSVEALRGETDQPPAKPDTRAASPPALSLGIDTEEMIRLLIEQLTSDDKYVRRPARDKLASMGLDAVRQMTKAYRGSEVYRTRLGVLVALTKMLRDDKKLASRVSKVLTQEDLVALVEAINTDNRLIRQYATEFLSDLGDPRVVAPALSIAATTGSDQSRYQAIYVVGSAYPHLNEAAKRQTKKELEQLKQDDTTKTNQLIDGIVR